jgi:outer membrane protein OmpA-like peptidoglycan-associated protein
MRKFLAVAIALGVSAFAASAQAQTSDPWSGAYAGISAGGSLLSDSGTNKCVAPTGINGTGCYAVSFGQLSGSGFIGGAQGGLQGLVPLWGIPTVLGFEFDMSGTTISGSSVVNLPATTPTVGGGTVGAAGTVTSKQTIDWLGTARLRAGYAGFNRLLIYGTAGVAFGQVDESTSTRFATGISYTAQGSGVKAGPTVGGGVEYAFAGNLSAKVEGLYYNLGSDTIFGSANPPLTGFLIGKEFRTQGEIFRIGLNYHFPVASSPPATPVAAPAAPPPAAMAPSKQMFIVFFEFDKSSLTPDGKKVVDAAAAAFKSGKSDIALAGYTDLSGTQQYNLALSHRRADTVKAALVKDGVSASAIGESWYGKQNPRVPTADGVREPQNRRVEITM